ncbi:MAG: hypothetical protein RI925_1921 [Pseudomonadota bacterium]|jgi:polar amino acid transport system permease protein
MSAMAVIVANLDYLLWGAWPDGALGGLALTLLMGGAAAAGASLLGIVWGVTLIWLSPRRAAPLAWLTALLRAIPVVMLIFWSYFLLPILFGVDVPGTLTVVCALTLIGGAYLAQTVRAGIEAIPSGQWQAGLSLGMTRAQTLRLIVLPQALRMMTPSFVNQWISLLKDTSLAYIVGVAELTFVASQVNNREQIYPLSVFVFVALLYLLPCAGLAWLGRRWEARVSQRA